MIYLKRSIVFLSAQQYLTVLLLLLYVNKVINKSNTIRYYCADKKPILL